ncbi:MAG: N-glycosylase/DNA lyase [Endomicrobium sp.]|jgi:N-glycosylase/DNA lyase|nr:N-glycosylase/DNA lyase [Endomicrobium sp.]
MKKNNLMSIDFIKTPINHSFTINELKDFWQVVLPFILHRQEHFKNVWNNGTEEEIFAELIFCIFTPQSKATICWNAVNNLMSKNMILNSKCIDIAKIINGVRFKNNKARYVIEARKFFMINGDIRIRKKLASFKDMYNLRSWLAQNIKGIGYKEAGHFLRNIFIGKDLAILDRHVLKNLKNYGVINMIPERLSIKMYLYIEKQMQKFAENIAIPMGHLDMLFWCKNTGGIFK